ncbi:MAG TPA: hypothetical protein VFF73_37030 [Planctomycetota bacterium]|nr:hypothetical protein [Planctomycetota bacterium]
MDRAREARQRSKKVAREIIEAGGDPQAAEYELRLAGLSGVEIHRIVHQATAVSRWRTRRAGLCLLAPSGAGLFLFGLAASQHGALETLSHSRGGFADATWWLAAMALTAGAALSMIVFGR